MKLEELREYMESRRDAAEREAQELKDSHLVLDRLRSLYRTFNAEDRSNANAIIADWLLSEDESYRFDALVLVDSFSIKEAKSTLVRLAKKLATMTTPGAPYELKKVRRVILEL